MGCRGSSFLYRWYIYIYIQISHVDVFLRPLLRKLQAGLLYLLFLPNSMIFYPDVGNKKEYYIRLLLFGTFSLVAQPSVTHNSDHILNTSWDAKNQKKNYALWWFYCTLKLLLEHLSAAINWNDSSRLHAVWGAWSDDPKLLCSFLTVAWFLSLGKQFQKWLPVINLILQSKQDHRS